MKTRALALLVVACWLQSPSKAVVKIDHEAECTYRQLTWDDFRGPTTGRSEEVVWIASTIVLEPLHVDVVTAPGGAFVARARNPTAYAILRKLESGAGPGARTDRGLAYEQIHFDITEYLARRLTRELRDLALEGQEREALQGSFLVSAEQRFAATLDDLDRMQMEVSIDTKHGKDAGAQRKWARKAAELLASEKPYELR